MRQTVQHYFIVIDFFHESMYKTTKSKNSSLLKYASSENNLQRATSPNCTLCGQSRRPAHWVHQTYRSLDDMATVCVEPCVSPLFYNHCHHRLISGSDSRSHPQEDCRARQLSPPIQPHPTILAARGRGVSSLNSTPSVRTHTGRSGPFLVVAVVREVVEVVSDGHEQARQAPAAP